MRLKISENLFLEKAELNRLLYFLVDAGHKQELLFHTKRLGLIKGFCYANGYLEAVDNLQVKNYSVSSVAINGGRAIDKNGDIISSDSTSIVSVPVNDLWYWIKIKYKQINEEVGTVSIDEFGNLSGVGTKFTEVLRGQPNFPAKIKFASSALGNTYEYEVLSVTDDETAVLVGVFNNESNLQYKVVGTFEPGYVVPGGDKFIFGYDSFEITLEAESPSGSNIAPVKVDGLEFYLARVKSDGANLIIEDKRTEFWQTSDDYEMTLVSRTQNPVIGIESVKWDLQTTFRDKNEVNISWGFRSSNWSIDTSTNKITINTGLGGILKENDLTFYTDGYFNGWRLYAKNGKYSTVISSQKISSQINIVLDFLDIDNFTIGDEIHIVPDVEEIEIMSSYDTAAPPTMYYKQIEERFVFPIHFSHGKIYLRIVDELNPYSYNLKYRYKSQKNFSGWLTFPNDTIGYYTETSFDDVGDLKPLLIDRVLKPYVGHATNGFCEIIPHPQNGRVITNIIYLGDLPGVEHRTLDVLTTEYQTKIGVNRTYQVYETVPAIASFASDIFIILDKNRADNTPCVNGNRFVFWLKKNFILNPGVSIKFVTDYVGPLSNTLLHTITAQELAYINNSEYGFRKEFVYDGTDWICDNVHELGMFGQGGIIMYSGALTGKFDGTGLGYSGEWVGWALCNGNNGTPDLRGRFIVGYYGVGGDAQGEYASIGEVGPTQTLGSLADYKIANDGKKIILARGAIPPHRHKYGFFSVNPGDSAIDWAAIYTADTGGATDITHRDTHLDGNLMDGGAGGGSPVGWDYANTGNGEINIDAQDDGLNSNAIENRPPFYTLAYVMKL